MIKSFQLSSLGNHSALSIGISLQRYVAVKRRSLSGSSQASYFDRHLQRYVAVKRTSLWFEATSIRI